MALEQTFPDSYKYSDSKYLKLQYEVYTSRSSSIETGNWNIQEEANFFGFVGFRIPSF